MEDACLPEGDAGSSSRDNLTHTNALGDNAETGYAGGLQDRPRSPLPDAKAAALSLDLPTKRILYMGGTKPKEEMETEKTLIAEAFTELGAAPQLYVADDSNDMVKWLEATNKEGKVFTLILIDIDVPEDSKDMNVCNAAKLMRLLNCSAPVLGFTSYPEKLTAQLETAKFGDFSQSAFNSVFPKPITKEMMSSIVKYYCSGQDRSEGAVDMYDSSGGVGLRSLLVNMVSKRPPSKKGTNTSSEASTQRELLSSEASPHVSGRDMGAVKGVVLGDVVAGDVAVVNERRGDQEADSGARQPQLDDNTTFKPPTEMQKILIVEDSPVSVKLYKKIFTFVFARFNISLQIDVASDGDEAIRLVQAGNKYLIITMDIEMERVGGIDAAKLLRILKVRSRIVACSGHSLTELMAEAFRADILLSTIDHFVQKPLTRDHVMEIVARFVLPKFIPIPIHAAVSTVSKYFEEKVEGAELEVAGLNAEGAGGGGSRTYRRSANVPDSVIRGLLSYIGEVKTTSEMGGEKLKQQSIGNMQSMPSFDNTPS